MDHDDEDDTNSAAKNFKDHHDACKVALAHLELLLKLAKLYVVADPKERDGKQSKEIADMIACANTEIKTHNQ